MELLNYVAENNMIRPSGTRHQLDLKDQVRHPKLFPTPKARDYQGAEGKRVVETKKGWSKIRKKSKVKYGASLNDVVEYMEMFPTPTANEDAAGTPKGKMQRMLGNCKEVRSTGRGTLSSDWVEGLMGYPLGWTDLGRKESQELKKNKRTKQNA